MAETETVFFDLPDDIVLDIFFRLQEDTRSWGRLACVCTEFSSLIRNLIWKEKMAKAIPAVISDILSCNSAAPGCWFALYKFAVCCPGLRLSGVLLENSDILLERELGRHYRRLGSSETTRKTTAYNASETQKYSTCKRWKV